LLPLLLPPPPPLLLLLLLLLCCRFHPVRAWLNTLHWGLMDNKYAGGAGSCCSE
jgi:hypothetical protein